MVLELFNPDNDMALASGQSSYTPPIAALRLKQAGSLLPLWYGYDGDKVLCYGVNDKWLTRMQEDFALGTDIFGHQDFGLRPDPWGWSLATRRTFLDEGFPLSSLPDDDWLQQHRLKSSRLASLPIAAALADSGIKGLVKDHGVACYDADEITKAIARFDNNFVAKQPWSSSGRGVANSLLVGIDRARKLAEESCRSQGAVVIESAHSNALDFAKIFEMHNGVCQELGTSVFTTDKNGSYSGNLLGSEQDRLSEVGKLVDLEPLCKITEMLCHELELNYPSYEGVIGVDMLVTSNGMIDPLVEVNLRKTMGYVALRLSDTVISPGHKGRYIVQPNKGKYTTSDYEIHDHRMVSGTLNLVPTNPHFDFLVKVDA